MVSKSAGSGMSVVTKVLIEPVSKGQVKDHWQRQSAGRDCRPNPEMIRQTEQVQVLLVFGLDLLKRFAGLGVRDAIATHDVALQNLLPSFVVPEFAQRDEHGIVHFGGGQGHGECRFQRGHALLRVANRVGTGTTAGGSRLEASQLLPRVDTAALATREGRGRGLLLVLVHDERGDWLRAAQETGGASSVRSQQT